MPKTTPPLALGWTVDPSSTVPLFQQIYEALRRAVLSGGLSPGSRLPSTRQLAASLRVSRATVVSAYDQLLAEGYATGTTGAGTYVANVLPERRQEPQPVPQIPRSAQPHPHLSQRGSQFISGPLSASSSQSPPRAFRPGLPEVDHEFLMCWRRLVSQSLRTLPPRQLAYGDAFGYGPLRQAIAEYTHLVRGVNCSADQVLIVSGSQQALYLAATILLDAGDAVLMEDPGYKGATAALIAAGATVVPVPVDHEGLDIGAGAARSGHARMAYVTPSHQYPLGVTMSLARRLTLLAWARQNNAWVLEDDYDSEYRYNGRPLPALQGLDGDGRVIYAGTFSKILFPALRLGYLVVPPHLIDAFARAKLVLDRHSPTVDQVVLARFIAEGYLARHIRRMRTLYQERQGALVQLATQHLHGRVEVQPADGGMYLVGWLPADVDDMLVAGRALSCGVDTQPLTGMSVLPHKRSALLLGYTAFDRPTMEAAALRLAGVFDSLQRP